MCLLAEDARYTNRLHVVRHSTPNLHEHLPSQHLLDYRDEASKQLSRILVSIFVALKVI